MRHVLVTLLVLTVILPQAPLRGDVVVDMPPPPEVDKQADVPEAEATGGEAAGIASEAVGAVSAAPAAQAAATPTGVARWVDDLARCWTCDGYADGAGCVLLTIAATLTLNAPAMR